MTPDPIRKGFRFLTALLCFFSGVTLAAGPQVLPSVEIGSDTRVLAPLSKKLLSFPEETELDSLPPFTPWETFQSYEQTAIVPGKIRPLALNLAVDTELGSEFNAIAYPSLKFLPRLAFDAGLVVTDTQRRQTRLEGQLQTRLSPGVLLNHYLFYRDTEVDSNTTFLYSYTLDNYVPSLKLASLEFSQLHTRAFIERLTDSADSSSVNAGLGLRNEISWNRQRLANQFILQDGAYGLMFLYRLPLTGKLEKLLSLGLMTDFDRLLPALDLFQRFHITPNLYLELLNRPQLRSWQLYQLNDIYPWSSYEDRHKITLMPLDYTLRALVSLPSLPLLKSFGIHHKAQFLYNQPEEKLADSGLLTQLSQVSMLRNLGGVEVDLSLFGATLKQTLDLNLEHLPGNNWRRRAYSPLLAGRTDLNAKIGNFGITIGMNQLYHQKDEFGRSLPDVIDLGLGLQIKITPDLTLKTQLDNLLNKPYPSMGSAPEIGRKFWIAFQYLPLH